MKTCGQCKQRSECDDGSGFDICLASEFKTGDWPHVYVNAEDDADTCKCFEPTEPKEDEPK